MKSFGGKEAPGHWGRKATRGKRGVINQKIGGHCLWMVPKSNQLATISLNFIVNRDFC